MLFKKTAKAAVLIVLVLIAVFSCTVGAWAIGWSGDSTTGGGASSGSATSPYALPVSGTAMGNLLGYRFAGIKADGSLANRQVHSFDVFIRKTVAGKDVLKTYARMNPQYSKKEYLDTFAGSSGLANTPQTYLVAGSTLEVDSEFTAYESSMGFKTALPNETCTDLGAALNTWQDDENNLNVIAKKVGYAAGINSMGIGDTITIEPIFAIQIDGELLAMTTTEMAYYGGRKFGWSSDGWTGTGATGNGAGTWGFIANYTNRYFGNTLYTPDSKNLGWLDVSTQANSRVTFADCIRYGYGVGICYTKSTASKPDVECVEIFFTDSTGRTVYDPAYLPVNTTIYVMASYRCNSVTGMHYEAVNYYMKDNTSSAQLSASRMKYSTNITYDYVNSIYRIDFASSGTKQSIQLYKNKSVYQLGTIRSSTARSGYIHSAVYLKGKTNAASEYNTSNNYKKVQYKFVTSQPSRDVGVEVELRSSTSTVLSGTGDIPYGSMVQVWHKYTNHGQKDEWVNGYHGSSTTPVSVNGSTAIFVPRGQTVEVLVSTFQANSFAWQSIDASVYLSGVPKGDTSRESNAANNTDSVSWRAKCDTELYQIIFEQIENGAAVKTWTRTQGTAATTPELPYGATIRVTYVFTNNSYASLRINGYKSTTFSNANKLSNASQVYLDPGQLLSVSGGTFVVTGSGSVSGGVCVYTSSSTDTGLNYETNKTNNKLTFSYTAVEPKDLSVESITYKYTNGQNVTRSHTVSVNNGTASGIPNGVSVAVYYKLRNSTSEAMYVDVYCTYPDGTRTKIKTNYRIAANGTVSSIFIPDSRFVATLGENGAYTIEIYETGKTSAAGETITTNNKLTAQFKITADVAVEILIEDASGNALQTSSGMYWTWQNNDYSIYVQVTNNTMYQQYVDVYFNGVLIATNERLASSGVSGSSIAFKYDDLYIAPGTYDLKAEVYLHGNAPDATGKPTATNESDTQNNVDTEALKIRARDVGILDIYYVSTSDSSVVVGRGDGVAELEYGEKYQIYFTLVNNCDTSKNVDVYYGNTKLNRTAVNMGAYSQKPYNTGVTLTCDELKALEVTGKIYMAGQTNANMETDKNNNVRTEQAKVCFNVAVEEIYLRSKTGTKLDPNNIPLDTELDVVAVLRNDAKLPITVDVYRHESVTGRVYTYDRSEARVNSEPYRTVEIPAGGRKAVWLKQDVVIYNTNRFYIPVAIGRAGTVLCADPYETNASDNGKVYTGKGVEIPYVTIQRPNADYREGTEVITSCIVHNPTNSAYTGIGGNSVTVHFWAEDHVGNVMYENYSEEIIYEATKTTVIPAASGRNESTQLVYFRWTVPTLEVLEHDDGGDMIFLYAEIMIPQYDFYISQTDNTAGYRPDVPEFTPDTEFEDWHPDWWHGPPHMPDSVTPLLTDDAQWSIWVYEGGRFSLKTYGMEVYGMEDVWLEPTAKTAYQKYGEWYTKSGYGYKIHASGDPMWGRKDGCLRPTNDMFTSPQSMIAAFPEFYFENEIGKVSTLEKVTDEDGNEEWQLCEFMDYGRVHWMPIWYPDGAYRVQVMASDIWTPAGMISCASWSEKITIWGDMYDDWHISHPPRPDM